MKKEQSSTPEVHLHEHLAPTYTINIGYVDKQINGPYYENNYHGVVPENQKPSSEKGKPKGQPKKVLFVVKGTNNEEDIAIKRREAERIKEYVKAHHMSGRKLTARKDDSLNEIIVAFIKRWQNNNLIGAHLPGAAVFRFLTEDVGLESEVTAESYASKITNFVTNLDVSVLTDREVGRVFR